MGPTTTLGPGHGEVVEQRHQLFGVRGLPGYEPNDQSPAATFPEHVTQNFPQQVFAFDEFGPLTIRPQAGSGWQPKNHPDRLPANYHKLHGVRQFHGCYSVGDDTMFGVIHQQKSSIKTLTALKSIRAKRPDGAPIYVILDNLSAHRGTAIRQWAARHKVELCFTPTYASWANPIEAHFGSLRTFVIAGSDHQTHDSPMTPALQ